jgi:acetyltransferase-like isoleucine patch superfamily enzyme
MIPLRILRIIWEMGKSRMKQIVVNERLAKRYGCKVHHAAQLAQPWLIELAEGAVIAEGVRLLPVAPGRIAVGQNSLVNSGSILRSDGGVITIGANVSLQYYSVIYGEGGCTIGNDCRISSHVLILAVNHVYEDPDRPIRVQGTRAMGIVIGDDVWIGAGAVILDGVHVGKGSVIGAGAVISKDVPPYSVVVGNPCKIVRRRCSPVQPLPKGTL